MNPLTRAIESLPGRSPRLVEGGRLSRPVSFVAGSSGPSLQGLLSSGPRLSADEALSNSAVVYRCVQQNTNPLARLDIGVRRTAADGTPGDLDLTHPMAQLWNRVPNPLLSAYVLKSIVWQQLELRGEAMVYLDRGETGAGPITEMWPIFHPVTLVANKQIAGQLDGYVVNVNGRKVPLLPSEVLWLRYPHPTNAWGCQAPWRSAAWAADLDDHARQWQLGEYLNGARPEGIFYLGDVDEGTHNATVEAWRSRHVGARNALKHLFVSGPNKADYTRVGLTPAEMSYIESRKVSAEEIMLGFGVHPDLLRGGATFENQRAAKVNQWTETLLPKLEVVASEADRQLLPDAAESFEFDISGVDALQENEDARAARLQKVMLTDVVLVDEARAILGLDPLPDGRGQWTMTAFRQHELDGLPGALSEAQAVARTAAIALDLAAGDGGRNVPPRRRAAAPQKPWRASRPGTRIAHVSVSQIEAHYDRFTAQGERVVRKLAEKQRRVVLRKAKELERKRTAAGQRANPDDLFDKAYWTEHTREALETYLSGIYEAGAMTTAGALGIGFDVYDPAVTAAMHARLDVLAGQITDTTHTAIAEALLEPGVEAGESIPDLAARLTSVFDSLESWRAETIARTETVGGYNAASREAAVASGQPVHRQWLATVDDRTRESHVELNGYETHGMSDAYPNGLMHPGDPSGPPAETINCRCVELFALPEDD